MKRAITREYSGTFYPTRAWFVLTHERRPSHAQRDASWWRGRKMADGMKRRGL
jgi:hypothetical protein